MSNCGICGKISDKKLSLKTIDGEKLTALICNMCYKTHKEKIQKHKLEVLSI